MIGRDSNKFSDVLALIQTDVLLVLFQADVLLPIEAPGEEINVTKVISQPGNPTTI